MSIIERESYLKKVSPYIDKNLIKVFVGQRRVGKSCLMKMTGAYILRQHPAANIIYIDKEQYEFDTITDYHALIAYVEQRISDTKSNYLFVDEVQEIKEFEKALRHFQNKRTVDIYCTGSNAKILSGDLATLLSGRYITIRVHSLSYAEFLEFHNLQDEEDSLHNYLKWGGLPYLRNLVKNDEVIFNYLANILSTIVYKDVLYRYKIRNVEFFDRLIKYIAANTGNLITSKKISDYLKSQKIDISSKVVLSYLQYLQNAFLIYKAKRVDVNSKRVFEINDKYFFEDWGLRNALLGLGHFSLTGTLENVVFSHLKQLGYEVHVGVLKNLEIDFVAQKGGEKLYIQVAYIMTNEKVKEREFGNLNLINDNYPKYVVSLDPVQIGSYKGIKHLHLREFLNKENFNT
ncbi:MAG TPA: ATP-binding protein [Ignavibacteria bacterium]|nr:ATP-binding protein [Ignavibacteria bacterium]